MSAGENKEIVRRYWEGRFNEKNYDVVDQYLSPKTYEAAQQKAWLDGCHAAIPDLRLTLDHLIAEDDLVVVHFTFEGTQETEWRGFPPTGQRLTTHGMALCRLADGMIIEDDIVFSDEHEVMAEAASA